MPFLTDQPPFNIKDVRSWLVALNDALDPEFAATEQDANTVLAGPIAGVPAMPGYRALVAADLPAGTGTVTSVALSAAPSSIFNVSGSPVTGSGTLALSMDTQTANKVLASPSSGGAAEPSFRSLVADDIPNLATSKINSGVFTVSFGGTGRSSLTDGALLLGDAANPVAFLVGTVSGQIPVWNNGTSTWEIGVAGTGTVTSVGLSLPTAIFDVSGSPVTGSGTLTATLDDQVANTFFSGPTTGADATPTFRALVSDDLPEIVGTDFANQTANTIFAGPSSGGSASPTFRALESDDIPSFLDHSLSVVDSLNVYNNISQQPALALLTHNGTLSVPTRILNNNNIGDIFFTGYNDADAGYVIAAYISAIATEDYDDSGDAGAKLRFRTSINSTPFLYNEMFFDNLGVLTVPSLTLGTPLTIANGGTGATFTSQNFAFIGPTSGAGAPSFRALVDGDIPNALTISGGTIENSIIGAATPVAGTFTTLRGNTVVRTGDGASGAKTIEFINANTGILSWNPSGSRTLVLPDRTDTLVTLNGTETLTAKTLTSPTINTATISGGTINNTAVGATTPNTGDFTRLGVNNHADIARIVFSRANGTPGSPTQVLVNEYLTTISAIGYHNAGDYGATSAFIGMAAAETFSSATNLGTNMLFHTTPIGSGTVTLRMTIEAGGTVDVVGLLRSGGVRVDADPGSGVASTLTLTHTTDTPTASLTWTSVGNPNGYIKAYIGTQAIVIPYWNT